MAVAGWPPDTLHRGATLRDVAEIWQGWIASRQTPEETPPLPEAGFLQEMLRRFPDDSQHKAPT